MMKVVICHFKPDTMTQTEIAIKIKAARPWMLGTARKYTGNLPDAEDIVGEATLKIIRFAGKYDPQQSFNSWVGVILKNTFLDFYRKPVNRAITTQVEDWSKTTSENISTRLEYKDTLRKIRCMKPLDRKILMQFAVGYTYEELAEMHCIGLSAVKCRIHRARKKLTAVA